MPRNSICSRRNQGCGVGAGVGVLWSRRFLGGVGVRFLTRLGVGVGFFCPTPTQDAQFDHFLHHSPKLGIPIEMVQFLLKLLLNQRFRAVHHDFHCFQQPNFIPFMLRSGSRKFWKGQSGKYWTIGVGSRSRIFYLRLRNPGRNSIH